MTSSAKGDADRQCLAARFVEGPRLFAPDEARQRLAGWLGDLAPEQASVIRGFAGRFPQAGTILEGVAEASSYLFDLMRADAARLIRLLDCDPDSHLAELVERTSLA
ncbi:MAG TPA: bifunctional [glutamine synthetase] adenylyltransferase/[glutamine synthetase]-adenylyl-L-tyrosine phosphorylase, partial [Bradyrhizobium sp.]|nr:bifunctional [glutamine synthetase] adenylyltransferase/[glutamine synthetase]-adenylyl-L-tyrosine phosphorylase [Bradyrhizobium sp.]